jgi:hypothetical protein
MVGAKLLRTPNPKEEHMNYIEQDHKLEDAAQRSSEDLARHRWHWTLDESNPDRVSLRQYAKDVGRNFATIRKYAQGYADWVITQGNHPLGAADLSDCIAKANLSIEKAEVAEAIAQTEGVSVKSVTDRRGDESLAVEVDRAREKAERENITLAEAAQAHAERRKQIRDHAGTEASNRAARHSLRYIEIEGNLARAKRLVTDAVEVAKHVDFTDEELELLTDTVKNLRAALDLLDLRFGGSPDIDWDAELATLGGAK